MIYALSYKAFRTVEGWVCYDIVELFFGFEKINSSLAKATLIEIRAKYWTAGFFQHL